ncbi:MAG: hypothetical protein FWH49_06790, partial [Clostridiales bacterium]|nr:hypothetical protein [Clostridiales bacterium]
SGARGKASAGSGKRDASMGSVVLRYLRDAVALLVLLLFCCVVSFRFSRANAYAQAYFQSLSEGDTESAETLIRAAAEWDFTKPEYKAAAALQIVRKQVLYGDAFSQSQMLAEGAGKQAQFSTAALGVLMEYYVMTGYNDTAWEISRRLTELEPYLSSYWLLRGELVNAVLSRYPLDAGEADEQAGGLENEAESGSEDKAESGSENSAEIEAENGSANDVENGAAEGSTEADAAAQAARLAEWKEIHRQWLERGLGIPDEMERMSADQWVVIEPGEELRAMVAAWQEALASL